MNTQLARHMDRGVHRRWRLPERIMDALTEFVYRWMVGGRLTWRETAVILAVFLVCGAALAMMGGQ